MLEAKDQQCVRYDKTISSRARVRMIPEAEFHVVTVGWSNGLIEDIWDSVARHRDYRFSHLMHPSHTSSERSNHRHQGDVYFFRDDLFQPMPTPDHRLLSSLEGEGVPTIHNMILGDRIVSKLKYVDALSYATFLARRMIDLFREIKPSVIIGGFDALHSGIGLAVARSMNIPWFALHFTVIPSGFACFCDGMSPASRVLLNARPIGELQSLAEASLQQFESRKIQASAYIAPPPLSLLGTVRRLPARLFATFRTIRKTQQRKFLQFTEPRTRHDVWAVLRYFYCTAMAREAISEVPTLATPPSDPYVLFGLHMQPESSIDVWAPFFSNQMWVIELLSRSIPPSHKLLVKIHKSDTANYSRERLEEMCAFPGVELVHPFADTRSFIENSDVVIAIQGTMGLEAALLGKPVIALDDSPFVGFPSVSRMPEIADLPTLIRAKLSQTPPNRDQIIAAYASYLRPFVPASPNNWATRRSEEEIDGYVKLLDALKKHLLPQSVVPSMRSGSDG